MEKTQTLLWLMLCLCSLSVQANTVINKVEYQGNKVTRESVLNREIYIKPGDAFNELIIEKSRQAIMDLGLFKTVTYYLEENYSEGNDEWSLGSINVVFVMEEKYFILLIPRLKVEDNEIFYGLQLKGDNILGLNHKIRVLAEDRGATANVDESRYLFSYFYPNVNASNYNLDFALQAVNDVDESDGVIDRQDESYRVGLTRWLNETGRNRGWFVGGSVAYQQRVNEDVLISRNSQSIDAIILGLDMGYKNINNFDYSRGGKTYGYRLSWSDERIGSEAKFAKHLFYYRSYHRFENDPASNINVQVKFGHANNNVLGDDAFSLGSSDDLRGYENNRFKGNTLFVSNFEYMFPHKNYPLFRYVTFIDMGSTYDSLSDVFHEPLNIGAGLGLRWKIRSLVKIDLRADVAYGFTDEDYKFSFGTRHAF